MSLAQRLSAFSENTFLKEVRSCGVRGLHLEMFAAMVTLRTSESMIMRPN